MVKIKFGNKDTPAPTPERPAAPERTPSISLKLKIKPDASTTSSATAQPPTPSEPSAKTKPKRAYTKKKDKAGADGESPTFATPTLPRVSKKRARKDEEEDEPSAPAKRPTMTRGPSISFRMSDSASSAAAPKSRGPKLKIPNMPSKLLLKNRSATTPRLKVKALGKPPARPMGVGYDSEADEVEIDPAIENQFILRMEPGEDCEYLREAIATSSIKPKGDEKRAAGPDIWMRFFDKQGRRGVVSIRGNLYATSLLDLPCVIEGMKSWDKRGFFKTADICQILLVLGRVKDDREAMSMPLPPEVDEKNWQYPHGLTPPMHYVRRRRFRKRINIRTIERVENDVEELFKRDSDCTANQGTVKFEWVDPNEEEQEEGNVIDGYEYTEGALGQGDDQDAEGEDDMEMLETPMEDAEGDEDEFMKAFEEEFANDAVDGEGDVSEMITVNPGRLRASPESLHPPESALTPASGTTSATDGEESQDDEDEDASTPGAAEEENEEEVARRREREQQQEEIDELKKDVAAAEEKWRTSVNPLLKTRALNALKVVKSELELKLSTMGLAEDE
jgi:transcription initiation factor TFIID subunit 7